MSKHFVRVAEIEAEIRHMQERYLGATIEIEVNGNGYVAIHQAVFGEPPDWPYPNMGERKEIGKIFGVGLFLSGQLERTDWAHPRWRVVAREEASHT